jgi:hypothetical protein
MGSGTLTIYGKVAYETTKTPACGLEVRAYEEYNGIKKSLGDPFTTKEEGLFSINFYSNDIRNPDLADITLYLEVLDHEKPLANEVVKKAQFGDLIELVVPSEPPKVEQFAIYGKIKRMDNGSLQGSIVTALDIEENPYKEVGRSDVKSNGDYSIKLSSDQLFRDDKKRASLTIRVNSSDGSKLAESSIVITQPKDQTVDFEIEPVKPPVRMRIVQGRVRYIQGLVDHSGPEVRLQEEYDGNIFDIVCQTAFRGDGTFKLEYTSDMLKNPNKPHLILQAFSSLYDGKPFSKPSKIDDDRPIWNVDLICPA